MGEPWEKNGRPKWIEDLKTAKNKGIHGLRGLLLGLEKALCIHVDSIKEDRNKNGVLGWKKIPREWVQHRGCWRRETSSVRTYSALLFATLELKQGIGGLVSNHEK